MMRMKLFLAGAALMAGSVVGQVAPQVAMVPNGSFEEVAGGLPAGWVLQGSSKGEHVADAGSGGSGGFVLSGDTGDAMGLLTAAPIEFKPGGLYSVRAELRSERASGVTANFGPTFANCDVGIPDDEWSVKNFVFVAPSDKGMATAPLRVGGWRFSGKLFFDNIEVSPVEALHKPFEGGVLGHGESIAGNSYKFQAGYARDSSNYRRPMLRHNAGFNTSRWTMYRGALVVHRHQVAERKFKSAKLEVMSHYHVAGRGLVEVSVDGKEWQQLGSITNVGTVKVDIPAEMFPRESFLVRVRGTGDPCNFQLHDYILHGELDGEPVSVKGSTHFIEAAHYGKRLKVELLDLGDLLPGGDNRVAFRLRCSGAPALESAARVLFRSLLADGATYTNQMAISLPRGGNYDVELPYEMPGVGSWEMTFGVSNAYMAKMFVEVPAYYSGHYGEVLPLGNPKVNLWRASSGWKVPKWRNLPTRVAKGVSLKLAANERESVQLVVAPNEPLTNVVVSVGELTSGSSKIGAEHIEVRRVEYVSVTEASDKYGVEALWPDPLLPQREGDILVAGENHPYWITVHAPAGTKPGIYRGKLVVRGDGVVLESTLSAEVYGFELPAKSTCETAFGLGSGRLLSYHGLESEEQRREVFEKYLKLMSESRISPYDPAPMDHWSLKWEGMPSWSGGTYDKSEKFSGKSSYLIMDDSTNRNASAFYEPLIAIPAGGLKISFRYKTTKSQEFVFSVQHSDSEGSWMPGCNRDIVINGSEEWQHYEGEVKSFPEGAASFRVRIYATRWTESGNLTGGLWLDDLKVSEIGSGKDLVEGGEFEEVDLARVRPVFDWSRWDAAVERAFNHYNFNSIRLRISGLGGGTFHSRYEPSFMGYEGGTPEYEVLMSKYLKAIEDHLREKGWLEKAYVYWFDEPDEKDYEFVMRGFETLKKYAPGLRRMLTEQVEPGLVGGPNVWCPLTPSLNKEGSEERREAGDEFWWYICCSPKGPFATEFIDHPGTSLRVWLWQTWAERVTGILIWETVYWSSSAAYPDRAAPQNPYLDPMSWVSGYNMTAGTRSGWGNGDGRFIYPPLAAADGRPDAPVLDDPVPSLRLALLRDGIEDYEYLVILRDLLGRVGGKLSPRERANMEELLQVPEEISRSLTSFTHDPEPIEAQRDKIARAIVRLKSLE